MAENFYTILTQIGLAKIANAYALGTKVNLTELAVGDGGGAYYNPVASQTELKNEKWRGPISMVDIDDQNSNWVVVEAVIPTTDGGFMVREVGIFDDEGDMIAIGKYPETYKPIADEGSAKDLYIRMITEVSNASAVTLKIDPAVVLATKKQVEEAETRAKNYTNMTKQELQAELQALQQKLGDLDDLDTEEKDNLVAAVNEIFGRVEEVEDDLDSHLAEIATQDKAGHIKLRDIPLPTIATQAEAEAGTNNTKMMTPLRTHQAIDSKVRIVDNVLELNVDGELKTFLLTYVPFIDNTNAPGPKYAIAGSWDAGFFGEVSANELISGDALASLVGISQGTSQHSTAGWLKFAWQGKILFVAKKAFRNSISWDHINSANAVYGDKSVVIDGLSYKIRLLKGANKDPAGAYDGAICHGSEWNRLMLPIHQEAINKNWAYPNNVENDIPVWAHNLGTGTQGMYTDEDLLTHYNFGSGSYSWCQEVAESTAYRVFRGNNGVSYSGSNTSSATYSFGGWRPCLELSV